MTSVQEFAVFVGRVGRMRGQVGSGANQVAGGHGGYLYLYCRFAVHPSTKVVSSLVWAWYGGVNHRCLIRFSAGRECGECGYGRQSGRLAYR